jgi:hypothetical protein
MCELKYRGEVNSIVLFCSQFAEHKIGSSSGSSGSSSSGSSSGSNSI